jgi:hypothetical protein
MLRLNQRGEGVTLGLVQGKFVVETDPADGVKTVSNVFLGRGRANSDHPTGSATANERLTLAELKSQVKGVRP